VWPGDGAIDLDGILRTLQAIGYNEMASIELFRPEYWQWEAEETIQTGKAKMENVLRRYFEIERV
jgi:2-keto-myo-inositol isomerase